MWVQVIFKNYSFYLTYLSRYFEDRIQYLPLLWSLKLSIGSVIIPQIGGKWDILVHPFINFCTIWRMQSTLWGIFNRKRQRFICSLGRRYIIFLSPSGELVYGLLFSSIAILVPHSAPRCILFSINLLHDSTLFPCIWHHFVVHDNIQRK